MNEINKYYSSDFDLGKTLQKALDRKGWTQKHLAAEIGVHKTHVNKWIKNRVRPSSSYIDLIARKMNISPYELLTGEVGVQGQKRNGLSETLMKSEMKSIEDLMGQIRKTESESEADQIQNLISSKMKLLLDLKG